MRITRKPAWLSHSCNLVPVRKRAVRITFPCICQKLVPKRRFKYFLAQIRHFCDTFTHYFLHFG